MTVVNLDIRQLTQLGPEVSWHHADRGDRGGRSFKRKWRAIVDQILWPRHLRAGITRGERIL